MYKFVLLKYVTQLQHKVPQREICVLLCFTVCICILSSMLKLSEFGVTLI